MSDVVVPEPDRLATEVLVRLALREAEEDTDQPSVFLLALHRRANREVFDAAVALTTDGGAARRALGVRILRELGPETDGGRPFRDETILLLLARLRDEPDPDVLRWIISALNYHAAREALPQILAYATHPDEWVRFSVAAAIPGLVYPADVEPDAADALIRLCQDDDADTRFYALYAATREVAGMNTAAMIDLTAQLSNDPDEQVRRVAADHHTAIHQVRQLLDDPRSDHLIGSLLTALALEADAADISRLLDAVGAGTPGMAERLVSWWGAEGTAGY
ncbi:HEAT repeat protein [Actinoplanes tereljensis]|uniref:HEAT repeat domain-containing protein n=1 Tax=Paractinoplanes tereljensis TaxID=571912 RepID=UPI0019455EB7|nr:HEAT repeat domain-containing protein [Actinoplanes tereljensis]